MLLVLVRDGLCSVLCIHLDLLWVFKPYLEQRLATGLSLRSGDFLLIEEGIREVS